MLKGVFSSVTQPDTKSSNVRNSVNTEENSLSGMKVVELKAMAKNRGLTGYSKLNKSQLVDLLG
jgi:hypothetical protein